MPKIQPRSQRVPNLRRDPPPPKKEDQRISSISIQQKDLKVSRYSTSGFQRGGVPGGYVYEKARARQNRHKEVYRSTAEGRAVVDEAVPLGRRSSTSRAKLREGNKEIIKMNKNLKPTAPNSLGKKHEITKQHKGGENKGFKRPSAEE